jgi:hypothetical protein
METMVFDFKNKIAVLLVSFLLIGMINSYAQSDFPVRTRWVSPDDSRPISFDQWKNSWDSLPRVMGGKVVYCTRDFESTLTDSFNFGDDYAYFNDYVRHINGSLCTHLPPSSSFIVWLNNDDTHILTDESPRWCFGDPNISGLGWFGIELGNFTQPAVAIGDTFTIQFSCYPPNESPEQGQYDKTVLSFNFVNWPTTLQLNPINLPEPPEELSVHRENGAIKICWRQESGLSYKIYRRNQNDTLALNFPRFQYEKIVENIVDSSYIDSTIDTSDNYAYILFAKDVSSGFNSGRSREIKESSFQRAVRAILVQPELYNSIETNLMTFVQEWENEDTDVVVYAMQFPSIQALRDTLRHIKDLTGALLIGDFPVPWFQVEDNSGNGYQEFPVDLYYMDLDGVWEDNLYKPPSGPMQPGSDGIFDTHYADYPRTTEKPEIVIGRITPTPGMGNPEEVINGYLNKCYDYRHDLNGVRQQFRALAFPDDDWHSWGQEIADFYLSQAYPDYQCISDINATTALEYRDQLNEHFSLIHVWVHSWSQGHAFRINNGTQSQYFYNHQILPAGANANFYLLFACGNSRYVEDQNCAAMYAFLTESGINTIGSTHSGGMLDYDYFYPALSQGITFGEAFLKTFQHVGRTGFNRDITSWYYGLTFNGDPFVLPQEPLMTALRSRDAVQITERFDIANYPNPFNSSTRILFRMEKTADIRLSIYNMLGELIFTTHKERVPAGAHYIEWNGQTNANVTAPSGIYFYKFWAGRESSEYHKMVLIK